MTPILSVVPITFHFHGTNLFMPNIAYPQLYKNINK